MLAAAPAAPPAAPPAAALRARQEETEAAVRRLQRQKRELQDILLQIEAHGRKLGAKSVFEKSQAEHDDLVERFLSLQRGMCEVFRQETAESISENLALESEIQAAKETKTLEGTGQLPAEDWSRLWRPRRLDLLVRTHNLESLTSSRVVVRFRVGVCVAVTRREGSKGEGDVALDLGPVAPSPWEAAMKLDLRRQLAQRAWQRLARALGLGAAGKQIILEKSQMQWFLRQFDAQCIAVEDKLSAIRQMSETACVVCQRAVLLDDALHTQFEIFSNSSPSSALPRDAASPKQAHKRKVAGANSWNHGACIVRLKTGVDDFPRKVDWDDVDVELLAGHPKAAEAVQRGFQIAAEKQCGLISGVRLGGQFLASLTSESGDEK